ncbi:MAG: PHP domain-containing protein, partial [Cetobacterium sp.]
MKNTYASLHTHTTYSLLDSTSTPEQMVDRAVELGLSAIAFTEHGNIFSWIKKKQYCDKKGIKYIHGVEFYLTESLEEKVRDNYHVILLAKNWDGVLEINNLYTKSTQKDHTYYRPRITFDEFIGSSNNIIALSACLGGVLNKLDKDNARYVDVLNRFDFLEVHSHMVSEQITYNKHLLSLNKPIIACGDFHEISDYKAECRIKWKEGKGTGYEGEDAFDLVMRGYDEFRQAFVKQGVLSVDEIDEAITNTNVVADMVENFELDLSFKFPELYDDSINLIREKTFESFDKYLKSGIIKEGLIDSYIDRIETELTAFRVLGMES